MLIIYLYGSCMLVLDLWIPTLITGILLLSQTGEAWDIGLPAGKGDDPGENAALENTRSRRSIIS